MWLVQRENGRCLTFCYIFSFMQTYNQAGYIQKNTWNFETDKKEFWCHETLEASSVYMASAKF